jgi:membrane protease YdiL (CAAX protease family)
MYNHAGHKPDPIRPLLGVGLYALGYWVLLNVVATVAGFLGKSMVALTIPPLVTASIMGAIAMAIFESRRLTDLGLYWTEGAGRNLLTGIVLGTGGAMLLILPPAAFGLAHFESAPTHFNPGAALFTLTLLFCGAAGEEIAFRGFPLQFLMRGYGSWIGIIGVGILFGLLHGFNPGATRMSMANTAGFGILFGFAVLRSHDLWLPIGFHFGWNATLPFLGVDLSGFTIQVVGYRLVWTAGDLWSGGTYGPEASLLASGVLLVLFLAVRRVPVRRGVAYLLDGKSLDEESADS